MYDDFQDGENRKRTAEKINYILEKLKLHNPQGTCLDTGCSNGIYQKHGGTLCIRGGGGY